LPQPFLQYEVVDLQGRIWRLDFAWPELRVAAEYDGVDWRSGRTLFSGTADARLRSRSWGGW
jgi:hypothetical protein